MTRWFARVAATVLLLLLTLCAPGTLAGRDAGTDVGASTNPDEDMRADFHHALLERGLQSVIPVLVDNGITRFSTFLSLDEEDFAAMPFKRGHRIEVVAIPRPPPGSAGSGSCTRCRAHAPSAAHWDSEWQRSTEIPVCDEGPARRLWPRQRLPQSCGDTGRLGRRTTRSLCSALLVGRAFARLQGQEHQHVFQDGGTGQVCRARRNSCDRTVQRANSDRKLH